MSNGRTSMRFAIETAWNKGDIQILDTCSDIAWTIEGKPTLMLLLSPKSRSNPSEYKNRAKFSEESKWSSKPKPALIPVTKNLVKRIKPGEIAVNRSCRFGSSRGGLFRQSQSQMGH